MNPLKYSFLDNYPGITKQFAEQARLSPEYPAVVCGNTVLTYHQLDTVTNQLARCIQDNYNLRPDDLVGVMMGRSVNLIITLLAVLKAGAAYVPMPPVYPERRLEFMMRDSKMRAIISEEAFKTMFTSIGLLPGNQVLIFEEIKWNILSDAPVEHQAGHGNLMYVMYTSGSTGAPKGVAVENGAVINVISHFRRHVGINHDDVILAATTYGFDISVIELIMPLICGATIQLASQQEQLNAESLARLIRDKKITIAQATPSTWQMIISNEYWQPNNRLKILCTGEYLNPDLGMELLSACGALWNLYGPTEATIWATMKAVTQRADLESIGQPVKHTNIILVNEELKEIPPGETGEILIYGASLARGYLNLPELTSARFVMCSTTRQPYYRTGDLGRILPNGDIQYLGRMDTQVKIRGYRIELGEIENELMKMPSIKQAVVNVQEEKEFYDKKLVAYLVHTDAALSGMAASKKAMELRNELKKTLPSYMIPYHYLFINALPMNLNGKVDRNALPAYNNSILAALEDEEPANEYEGVIKDLWKKILGITGMLMTDNFFEIGGHSVSLTRLYRMLPDHYREKVSMPEMFDLPSVRSLAEHIRLRMEATTDTADPVASSLNQILEDAEGVPEIPELPTLTGDMEHPKHIFLTGVTGFVGSHLLAELLASTQATIYCLIRADDEQLAKSRLRATFDKYHIDKNLLASERIHLLRGDLSRPNFNLSQEHYDTLAQNVDIIYHSGSAVSYIFSYSMVRKSNIAGIHEIIRLATSHKLKCISYISTTAVYSWGHYFTRKTWMLEDDDMIQNLDAISRGTNYVKSKWVTEQILSKIISKGVPVIIFRSGFILCHSKTGATAVDQWYARMVLTCIKANAFPLLMGSKDALISVDYLCRAMVHISGQRSAAGKKFNVTPDPINDITNIEFLRRLNEIFGFTMQPLMFHEWLGKWQHDEKSPLYPLLSLYKESLINNLCMVELYQNSYYFSCVNTREFLTGTDINPHTINKELLEPYLRFIKAIQ
ncbi:non-ribosomal peptide synthetase [Chitinophaga solisilvae]|uniref:non-ribosomal peptide synthetase n=1 Tax=Chitinophaga solisilvae TaxID=1233460 RepID=UPI00136D0FDB|nr:non-ribosomal peptide synthetase [Chitinophaga solisilvae]